MLERRDEGVWMKQGSREQGAGGKRENKNYLFPLFSLLPAPCLFPILNFTQIFLKNLNIWYASLVFLKKF
jgi:hypothetical protein